MLRYKLLLAAGLLRLPDLPAPRSTGLSLNILRRLLAIPRCVQVMEQQTVTITRLSTGFCRFLTFPLLHSSIDSIAPACCHLLLCVGDGAADGDHRQGRHPVLAERTLQVRVAVGNTGDRRW